MHFIIIIIIVGRDYTTLTGNEDIKAVFPKGSNISTVLIPIRHDLQVENEEYFTAHLLSAAACQPNSINISILDTTVVLCTFDEAEYIVYESVGHVNLTLNSSRPISDSNYTVQVVTVFGIGNATREC